MEYISNPYLEKDKPIEISSKDKLPHWHQDGKIQFITFRLADSLPQSKVNELKEKIQIFENHHPRPWDETTLIEYHKIVSPEYEKFLDNGYGECILKESRFRRIIKEAIFYYNDSKYEVIAFVIMPNHVHLLLRILKNNKLNKIMQSIKRYSAREINKQLNRDGALWMKRYFDRIVRNREHLNHCLNYIKENPKYLKQGEYLLYINPQYDFGETPA